MTEYSVSSPMRGSVVYHAAREFVFAAEYQRALDRYPSRMVIAVSSS